MIILANFLFTVSAINCYQCTSMEDIKCKDASLFYRPEFCNSNETSCLKYYAISNNNGYYLNFFARFKNETSFSYFFLRSRNCSSIM